MPLMISPASPTGILQWAWIDPDGTERDLTYETSPRRFVSKGSAGLGMPTYDLASDKLPFAPGSLMRHIGTQMARIELPITIIEDSFGDVVGVLDDLRGWFDTGDERALHPGILRVIRPDDSVRQIAAFYAGGLEGDLSRDGPNSATVIVSLVAPDPWPTEDADTVVTWVPADYPSVAVINQGQLDAYPVWHLTGNSTATTITNTTTGKSFTLNAGTAPGAFGIILDTRPAGIRDNIAARRDSDDFNVFPNLAAASSLWWLAPGQNNLTIAQTGTDGTTQIELSYRARYRGLLR